MSVEALPTELREAYVKYGYTLFLDAAEEIDRLRSLIKTDEKFPLKVRMGLVCDTIEDAFGIERGGIKCNRTRNNVKPRQIAMHISFAIGNHSKSSIAREFNRNHATVIHALKTVADWMAMDEKFRGVIENLTKLCIDKAREERKINMEKMKCLVKI